MATNNLPNNFKRTPMKTTIHKVEHLGQEYLVDSIIDAMNNGAKLSVAIKLANPQIPAASVPHLATKIKKHPYFIAYKDASLKILTDKGAALQQNALDLAFNARSEMVRADMTKDTLNRIYGDSKEDSSNAPAMTFNFSFGGPSQPQTKSVQVIDGEVVE